MEKNHFFCLPCRVVVVVVVVVVVAVVVVVVVVVVDVVVVANSRIYYRNKIVRNCLNGFYLVHQTCVISTAYIFQLRFAIENVRWMEAGIRLS